MTEETLLEAEEKMEKAVTGARGDYAAIRTGQAAPANFNTISAHYYGAPAPVSQLAAFAVPEPRMVVISPFDVNGRSAITNAVRNTDVGVNPSDDGQII